MTTAELFPPIPADTAKLARAVFGSSNFYMATGERANRLFGGLLSAEQDLPARKSARQLAELYLITIFQYIETLPDNQAADALRERVDWKYALHLPLRLSGYQPTVFCDFRRLVLEDQASYRIMQSLITRLCELVGSTNGSFLEQEAGRLVRQVCTFSRLVGVWEAVAQALQALAIKRPEWLRGVSRPHWYERYSHPRGNLDLRANRLELERLAQAIGDDGAYLLEAVAGEPGLENLPEVRRLRQVWDNQYQRVEGKVAWRTETCANCSAIARFWGPLERDNQA
jgi:transposase